MLCPNSRTTCVNGYFCTLRYDLYQSLKQKSIVGAVVHMVISCNWKAWHKGRSYDYSTISVTDTTTGSVMVNKHVGKEFRTRKVNFVIIANIRGSNEGHYQEIFHSHLASISAISYVSKNSSINKIIVNAEAAIPEIAKANPLMKV